VTRHNSQHVLRPLQKKFDPKFKRRALPFAYTRPIYTKNAVRILPRFRSLLLSLSLSHAFSIHAHVHMRIISLFFIIIIRNLNAKATFFFHKILSLFDPLIKISNLSIKFKIINALKLLYKTLYKFYMFHYFNKILNYILQS